MNRPCRVLVFAGLDPSGRAGLLADGEAIRSLGAQPVLSATALAVQSSHRLLALEPVRPSVLEAQAAAALEDGPIAAVKIGMVATPELLGTLLSLLRGPLAGIPAVIDPVLESSRGGALFEGRAEDYVPLLKQAALVTPNLAEAARLTGREVRNREQMAEAARALIARGARAALIKGGHLSGDPADLLLADNAVRWYGSSRIPRAKRGTGCRLASAIAAGLAQGRPLQQSIEQAIAWVRAFIEA